MDHLCPRTLQVLASNSAQERFCVKLAHFAGKSAKMADFPGSGDFGHLVIFGHFGQIRIWLDPYGHFGRIWSKFIILVIFDLVKIWSFWPILGQFERLFVLGYRMELEPQSVVDQTRLRGAYITKQQHRAGWDLEQRFGQRTCAMVPKPRDQPNGCPRHCRTHGPRSLDSSGFMFADE